MAVPKSYFGTAALFVVNIHQKFAVSRIGLV